MEEQESTHHHALETVGRIKLYCLFGDKRHMAAGLSTSDWNPLRNFSPRCLQISLKSIHASMHLSSVL